MDNEKISGQTAEAASEPAAEAASAPVKRRRRRTKEEIEADAKKAASAAKKAAGGALDTVAKAAKQAVGGGAKAAGKISSSLIPAPEVVVQYSGAEIGASALTDAAVAQFKAAKKRARIKDIKLYIKPEERAAYYVINGSFNGKVDF